MQEWGKIEIITKNKERRIFERSYFKMRDGILCIEDGRGNSVCIPEKNVEEIHLIQREKSLYELVEEVRAKMDAILELMKKFKIRGE